MSQNQFKTFREWVYVDKCQPIIGHTLPDFISSDHILDGPLFDGPFFDTTIGLKPFFGPYCRKIFGFSHENVNLKNKKNAYNSNLAIYF